MAIHFLGPKNIDEPVVWIFTELVVCVDCGIAECAVPEAELLRLAEGRRSGTMTYNSVPAFKPMLTNCLPRRTASTAGSSSPRAFVL